jgi:beta-phosphoglucomutase family hydrolase
MPPVAIFDAVLFDLDGVLTPTAAVHAACWKVVFDEVLGTLQAPFDVRHDYLSYVDGRAREDGVRTFLAARGLAATEAQIRTIGERKQALVDRALERDGIAPYPGSLAWLTWLRDAGVPTAVVSSSANCARVLRAAGIDAMFDTVVDGRVAALDRLRGKPAPDTFLAAAADFGVPKEQAVVFEDALAGVAAGRTGGFGFVVGVDRLDQAEALREHGADVVVSDLADLLEEGS